MSDTDTAAKFTLQISETGGLDQFVCTGEVGDVVKLYEHWAARADQRREEMRRERAEAPQPPTAGSTPGAGSARGALRAVPSPLKSS